MKLTILRPFGSSIIKEFVAILACFVMIAGPSAALTVSGQKVANTKSDDIILSPQWSSTWTGAFNCKAVNDSTAAELAHITTDNELGLVYTPPTASETAPYTAAGGTKTRVLVGPSETASTITTTNSGLNSLNWTSTKAIGAVLVGGSGGNRIYWMPEGSTLGTQFSGTGFQNANASQITKVSFCYHQPAKVTIIQEVTTFSGGTASPISFPFTQTNLGANFSLVDNNVVGPDRTTTLNLYKFAKWGQGPITVTQSLVSGWTLADLTCVEMDTVLNQTQYATTTSLGARNSTINLEEGEMATCTYRNTQLIPSAAQVDIAGRVLDEYGTGIRGASLTLTNANTLETRTVTSSSFGYYRISNVDVGDFYILTVNHKKYGFPNGQMSFNLFDALTNLDFVGIQ